MTDEMNQTALLELSTTLSKIDDIELLQEFLKCLLTDSEISEVMSRWTLVRRIKNGQTQRSIAAELGLSLCKITRGSKELKKEDSAFNKVIEIFDESVN
ncbi:MAG: trp operon repressor [Spirochaetaceae bacterium]